MTEAPGYDAFAERLIETGVLADPWLEGRPRFREEPVFLTPEQQGSLYRAAEQVAAAVDEACRMLDADGALVDEFLGLSPYQKMMWEASRPLWHGIARADVFFTEAGPVVCEINSDTPTGQPEAVLLGALTRGAHPGARDPNEGLRAAVIGLFEAFADSALGADPPLTVGLVYPTELTEDLSLVRLYRQWLEEAGYRVTLGSPFNLSRAEGGELRLFDTPIDLVVRHYKTDWWGERRPIYRDDPPPADPLPLDGPLHAVLTASLEQACVVVNPFGAVVAQNKRLFAFLHERIDLFSPRSQRAIRALVPETLRLETAGRARLLAERERWVLKSDYGAEGDEVLVGKHTAEATWAEALEQAMPGRWVAQRYFAALEGEAGESVNHGVYLVAGEASGLYARVQRGPTDVHARSAPTLVVPQASSDSTP